MFLIVWASGSGFSSFFASFFGSWAWLDTETRQTRANATTPRSRNLIAATSEDGFSPDAQAASDIREYRGRGHARNLFFLSYLDFCFRNGAPCPRRKIVPAEKKCGRGKLGSLHRVCRRFYIEGMQGTWTSQTIAGKTADVFDPPERPRFGVLHLHPFGLETLRDK